jgi:hypothetical protein
LLPGSQVQITDPGGLSVDGKGNILFVDTGNNMERGYVPQSQHVMDPLGGCTDDNGNPQGGNNGMGQWSDKIELSGPLAVTSTAGLLLVVADSGNKRLVQPCSFFAAYPGSTIRDVAFLADGRLAMTMSRPEPSAVSGSSSGWRPAGKFTGRGGSRCHWHASELAWVTWSMPSTITSMPYLWQAGCGS